jgi:hypothetical protein
MLEVVVVEHLHLLHQLQQQDQVAQEAVVVV